MSAKRYGEICRKVEDALEDHIQKSPTELISSITIAKGFSIADVETERIEIIAEEAKAEMLGEGFTGNWFVNVSIAYAYNYKDVTRAAAQSKASELFDLFLAPDIANQINAHSSVADFAVYGGSATEGQGLGTGFEVESVKSGIADEHTLIQTMTATIYCRPSGMEV